MSQAIKLMITAGGTGGHVFPGIAVAHAAQTRGFAVSWIGRPESKEAEWVRAANIPFQSVTASALRGKGLLAKLLMPWRLLNGFRQARKLIKQYRPDAVIGFGGYVAAPVGFAAWSCRVPLFLHEQNAVAGLTNKVLARLAKRVLAGFRDNGIDTAEFVGNPVRRDIRQIDKSQASSNSNSNKPLTIGVLGGSQGARFFNQNLPAVLSHLSLPSGYRVVHQTGKQALGAVKLAYAEQGRLTESALDVRAFVDDMPAFYDQVDVLICRAGALTVAEVAQVGMPTIFVPFPHAVDDHQTKNAQSLVDACAAKLVQEADFDAQQLQQWLETLGADEQLRQQMAIKAKQTFPSNSVDLILASIEQVIRPSKDTLNKES